MFHPAPAPAPAPALAGMLVDVVELRITQAENLIIPFWECSTLDLFNTSITFLLVAICSSIAAVGISINWPLLVLSSSLPYTYYLVTAIFLEDISTVHVVSYALSIFINVGIYFLMIFLDSKLAKDPSKNIGVTATFQKDKKKAGSEVQSV